MEILRSHVCVTFPKKDICYENGRVTLPLGLRPHNKGGRKKIMDETFPKMEILRSHVCVTFPKKDICYKNGRVTLPLGLRLLKVEQRPQ
jgi:hypothetical protein